MIYGTAEELGGKPVPLSQGSSLIPARKSTVLRRPLIPQGTTLLLSFRYFLLVRIPVCCDWDLLWYFHVPRDTCRGGIYLFLHPLLFAVILCVDTCHCYQLPLNVPYINKQACVFSSSVKKAYRAGFTVCIRLRRGYPLSSAKHSDALRNIKQSRRDRFMIGNSMATRTVRKLVTTNIRYVAVGAISIHAVRSKFLLSPWRSITAITQH